MAKWLMADGKTGAFWPSAISHQPSAISHQPSAVSDAFFSILLHATSPHCAAELRRASRAFVTALLAMTSTLHHAAFLTAAIEEAEDGLAEGGIPIGAVLVHGDRIIGRGHNRRVQQGSAVLHGEMDALERAGRQRASTYRDCVMYTTLSPCAMCSGAIVLYGIRRVIVGENRTFLGEEEWLRSRGVQVDVVQDECCIRMMERFIDEHPELWHEDIGI
jgi:creatinine deaminase